MSADTTLAAHTCGANNAHVALTPYDVAPTKEMSTTALRGPYSMYGPSSRRALTAVVVSPPIAVVAAVSRLPRAAAAALSDTGLAGAAAVLAGTTYRPTRTRSRQSLPTRVQLPRALPGTQGGGWKGDREQGPKEMRREERRVEERESKSLYHPAYSDVLTRRWIDLLTLRSRTCLSSCRSELNRRTLLPSKPQCDRLGAPT